MADGRLGTYVEVNQSQSTSSHESQSQSPDQDPSSDTDHFSSSDAGEEDKDALTEDQLKLAIVDNPLSFTTQSRGPFTGLQRHHMTWLSDTLYPTKEPGGAPAADASWSSRLFTWYTRCQRILLSAGAKPASITILFLAMFKSSTGCHQGVMVPRLL